MKDAYSIHVDAEDLERFYPKMIGAYRRVFERCGVAPIAVEADSGMMGGSASHEFILPNADGEDTIVLCSECGYAANVEHAALSKRLPNEDLDASDGGGYAEIATPGCRTIQEVAEFVGVDTWQTLKAVFFTTREASPRLILAVIRGDLEVNETKLSRVIGGAELFPAEDQDIRAVGAVPGYASPIGVRGALVVADDSVRSGGGFTVGANREGYHLMGVRYERDFTADLVSDIALAREGDACPRCSSTLRIDRGIELGHCFKLGTRYTEAAEITYLDSDGEPHPIVMGSYGIGIGRLMAAVIETHHDDYGILWPASVAPYQIHLVSLARDQTGIARADEIYDALTNAGLEVLYDDRIGPSAGVKFNDADLIGCPLRLTVSQRSLAKGGVEAKWRAAAPREVIQVDRVEAYWRAGQSG